MRENQEESASITGDLLQMTAEIVASFVRNNPVDIEQLPELIRSVHAAMSGVAVPAPDRLSDKMKPAAPIAKSVHDDYIICLEDGKKLKMLRRYLKSNFNMTPDEYRRRWGLPPDYPMVAPAYARRRSAFAKEIGLGRGVRKRDG